MKLSFTLLAIIFLPVLYPQMAKALTRSEVSTNYNKIDLKEFYLAQDDRTPQNNDRPPQDNNGNNNSSPLQSYVEAGMKKYESGDYQGAVEQFTAAIEIDATIAELYLFRGISYQEIGDREQALADANKAISLQPDLAIGYELRGFVYSSSGDGQQALTDFQKAAELYQQQGNTEGYQRVSQTIDQIDGK